MRKLGSLLAAASLMIGARAGAVDLTGIWSSTKDGAMKCRYFDGTWKSSVDGNIGLVSISQVGTTLYLEINHGLSAPSSTRFKGIVLDAASNPAKGVATATACQVDGVNYHGVYSIRKAEADMSHGAMSVEFFGTSIGVAYFCKAKFERTDPGDPGITQTCP